MKTRVTPLQMILHFSSKSLTLYTPCYTSRRFLVVLVFLVFLSSFLSGGKKRRMAEGRWTSE